MYVIKHWLQTFPESATLPTPFQGRHVLQNFWGYICSLVNLSRLQLAGEVVTAVRTDDTKATGSSNIVVGGSKASENNLIGWISVGANVLKMKHMRETGPNNIIYSLW